MPKSTSVELQARFLSALLQEREVQPRALLLAQQITEILPGAAAVVYLLEPEDSRGPARWSAKAVAGDIHLDDSAVSLEAGTLGLLAGQKLPLMLSGSKLVREDFAHLPARRTLLSLAYVPMIVHDALIGAVEVATFDDALDEADLSRGWRSLAVAWSATCFVRAVGCGSERNSNLESVLPA